MFAHDVIKIPATFFVSLKDIPYLSVLDLIKIYKNMGVNDKKSFIQTVKNYLNNYYEPEPQLNDVPDDLPF